jgi:hypothetical protein
MPKTLPIVLALFASTLSCAAQQTPAPEPPANTIPVADQATNEQLSQLFEAMHVRTQMDTMLKAMPRAIQEQIQRQESAMEAGVPGGPEKLTASQKEAAAKITGRYTEEAFKLYPVEEMLSDIMAIYKRHLTSQDVTAIIAFYKTPAGIHLLDNQSAMMQEIMPLISQKMQDRFQVLASNYVKELSEALQTPAPATK